MAGGRRILELAFNVASTLDPSFTRTLGEAGQRLAGVQAQAQGVNRAAANQRALNAQMRALEGAAIKTGKAWGKVGASIMGPIKAFATFSAAAGGAALALGMKTAEAADNAVKAAKKIGITTQSFTELAYAAEQSNIGQDTLSATMKKLDLNIAAAAKGSKEAQFAFERAGVSVYDAAGKLKTADVLMMEMSKTFANMPEGVYKTDLAIANFGKSGAELVPLLEQGDDAINKLRKDANRLGLTLEDETAEKATALMGSLTEAKSAMKGLGMSIGSQLWEPLTKVTQAFSKFIVENRELISLKVGEVFKEIQKYLTPENFIKVKDTVAELWKKIDGVAQALGGWGPMIEKIVIAWGAFKGLQVAGQLSYATMQTYNFGKALASSGVAQTFITKHLPSFGKGITGLGKSFMGCLPAIGSFSAALFASPITWIVIGIIALIAAIILLWKNWDKVSAWFAKSFPNAFDAIKEVWVELVDGFNMVKDVIMDVWDKIKEPIMTFVGWYITCWTTVFKWYIKLVKWYIEGWKWVIKIIIAIWDKIKGPVMAFVNWFMTAFLTLLKWYIAIWKWGFNMVIAVWNTIVAIWDGIVGTLKGKFAAITSAFDEGFIKGILTLIKEFNPWVLIIEAINGMIKAIFGIDLLAIGKEWIGGFIDGILSGIKGVGNVIKSVLPGPLAGLLPFAEGGWVTKPTPALVGESGPEVIIPVSKPNRAMELLAQVISAMKLPEFDAGAAAMPNPAENLNRAAVNNTDARSSNTYTFSPSIVVNGGGSDAAGIKQAVEAALKDAQRMFEDLIKNHEYQSARLALR